MDHWNSFSLDFYQKLMVFNNDEIKYYDHEYFVQGNKKVCVCVFSLFFDQNK